MSSYAIMGGIGVGKSTLLKSASKAGYTVYDEYVNGVTLARYIRDPKPHAYRFQLAMMHGSITRTRDACAHAKGIVIERPALENIIFAQANADSGRMSSIEFQWYTEEIRDYASQQGKMDHYVYLYASEDTLWQRMTGRARAAEDEYKDTDDHYMDHLADCYFRALLELALRQRPNEALFPTPSPWQPLPTPLVMDWSSFGTWQDVARKIVSCAPMAVSLRVEGHTGCRYLSPYFRETVWSPAARTFRDDVMKQLAQGMPVNLLVLPHELSDVARKLQIYA